jgi:hypothetical protein
MSGRGLKTLGVALTVAIYSFFFSHPTWGQ